MTINVNGQPTVIRTGRGLTVAGTRITLYTILEYLHADWPPKLIQQWLDLTERQMADVLDYLARHREAVEQEYLPTSRENYDDSTNTGIYASRSSSAGGSE